METPKKQQESRLRARARRNDLSIHKSRQQLHCNNHGGYQIVDARNTVVAGLNYELTLDDVETFLTSYEVQQDKKARRMARNIKKHNAEIRELLSQGK
jgi:hypothetical protein